MTAELARGKRRCDGGLEAAEGEQSADHGVARDERVGVGADGAGRGRLRSDRARSRNRMARRSDCQSQLPPVWRRGTARSELASRDVLDGLLATCRSDPLADTRDLAILLLAFASGGRRRSEVAQLPVEQLSDEPPLMPRAENPRRCPAWPFTSAAPRPARRTRGRGLLVGPPVEALREWFERAEISKGPIFRAIDRWEALEERALTPQSINLIVKRRCALAGFEAREFYAHGLRSGYLTEAAQRGVSLPETMQQSQRRSVQQAASYYNDADRRHRRALRLRD
jgi:integrase